MEEQVIWWNQAKKEFEIITLPKNSPGVLTSKIIASGFVAIRLQNSSTLIFLNLTVDFSTNFIFQEEHTPGLL